MTHKHSEFVDCGSLKFLLIPKNASSYTKKLLVNYPVKSTNSNGNFVVILRDPLERWLSGTVQFLISNHARHRSQHFSFAKVCDIFFNDGDFLDAHTQPQSYFIEPIADQKIMYVFMNQNLKETLIQICSDNNISMTPSCPINVGKNNIKKKDLYMQYENILQDPHKKSKILSLYEKDYQLINSVDFYNIR